MALLTFQHRVGDNIIRISIVFGNKFFHPYHIVPLIKFVGTFMKNTDSFITEFFVKANTVVMQMFILMFSVRNTSIYICYTLLCENFFELFVEFSSDSVSVILKADINTCFNLPIIRFSAFENSGIRIADNFSVEFGYNIRAPFERSFYAICKFFNAWNIVFKCYCRVFNIWFVYGEQFFGVAYLCRSDMQFIVHDYDLFNTL